MFDPARCGPTLRTLLSAALFTLLSGYDAYVVIGPAQQATRIVGPCSSFQNPSCYSSDFSAASVPLAMAQGQAFGITESMVQNFQGVLAQ